MAGKTRAEILEAIRGAGAKNSRLEFMRICSAHPLDFATANHAFLEGRDAAQKQSDPPSVGAFADEDGETPLGRYAYDFGRCAIGQGWAKFSSAQDDVDFGNWANPSELKWMNYREGEATLVEFADRVEFIDYCRATMAWYEAHDGRRPAMDPGFNEDLRAEFVRLGLEDLLARPEDD